MQTTLLSHEEKIESLSTQMTAVSGSIHSIQNILVGLQKSVETLMLRPSTSEAVDDDSGKTPPPPLPPPLQNKPPEDSLFSLPKVKLPPFDGTDARGWISKAELYFQVHKTPPDQKLSLSQMCMEGSALHWYTNLLIRHPATSWEQFRLKMLNRFNGTRYRNAHEALGSLFQDSNVEEYIEAFEELSALIPDQTEEQSIGWYLRGLKMEIRNWVRTLNPSTCDEAMEYSRNVENAMGGRFDSSHSRQRQEWEDRRKRGLCFRCGLKYNPQHKCADGGLRILLLAENETAEDEGEAYRVESPTDEEGPGDDSEGTCLSLEISNPTSDLAHTGTTIKLEGEINEIPILILVDSGATHNFLSKRVATSLGLPILPSRRTCIKMGDDRRVWMTEQCRNIPIKLGDFSFTTSALVYELGALDMILGTAWLKTLGDVLCNWSSRKIQFWSGDTLIKLQGVAPPREWLSSLLSCTDDTPSLTRTTSEICLLNPEQREQLTQLLEQFDPLFTTPKGLPPIRTIEHSINLMEGQGPVCVRPYRYPHLHKDEIQRQVEEMMEQGIIRPSQSAYSSPVILVKKKDSTWRLCIDYRALNKVTILDKYPIPMVEELLDELHDSRYYSKIDLKSEFYQVRVREEDIGKTAFRTHNGHYEFLVMPFGLTNAPATFQSLMNDVFRKHLRKGVLVFFDDILIYSSTWEEHMALLSKVLSILHTHQLVVNKKKSSFGKMSVEYLGHIIDSNGVSMDPAKIASVLDWPTPKTVKAVRGFLGLTGYYRKFIRDYGKIAKPLTELTKKDGFSWGPSAQEAFDKLKHAMTSASFLSLPDFSAPFLIECDASGRGLGAVLMQAGRPVTYFSKALSDRNLNKSAYEKELMALRITTTDQQNWIAKLLGYQFSIVYKPGSENRAADALSRIQEGELQNLVSTPTWLEGRQLQDGAESDPFIQAVTKSLASDPSSRPGFAMVGGKLFRKGRLVIPATSHWIPTLLEEFHSSPTGGHSGFYRTYRRLAGQLYWVGMTNSVKQFVRSCDTCQRYKSSTLSPNGLLQPLPIPQLVWEDISLDFITGLPKSKGYETVLVVVDRLSKYCHFILLKRPFTARTVAEVFLREIIRLHGIPKTILSDRDPLFLSTFWKEVFKLQGSKLNFSSAYHPETDGQTEVVNRSLETYLHCFAAEQPKSWSSWLPWAEYWHNTAYHVSTNTTPFEVVYGRPPPTILRFVPGEVQCEAVTQDLIDRDEAIRQLKYHLSKAQERMKHSADKHRRDESFEIGDQVFLKLRPHRQQSVARRINQKLSARYYGPFTITSKIGTVAYKLQLPEESRIHPVFHVSLLKRAVGTNQVEPTLPVDLEMDRADLPTPKTCLAVRDSTQNGETTRQWLIQWDSESPDNATWEDAVHIQHQFPDFKLEDKLDFQEGGTDRNPNITAQQAQSFMDQPNEEEPSRPKIWKVYSRKKHRQGHPSLV
ncbi:hypothetical protein LXL04_034620 [Taraxacum kok-saghyz]